MAVPLSNCDISIEFRRPRIMVNGREQLGEPIVRETRGFITTEWSRVAKTGIIPHGWEGKQRLQLTMKDNFDDDDGNPLWLEPDMNVTVSMDNGLIDTKIFKVVDVPVAPTGKIAPAWLVYLGEAAA